jgi:hypothetical protein
MIESLSSFRDPNQLDAMGLEGGGRFDGHFHFYIRVHDLSLLFFIVKIFLLSD